jgi:tetratricopeptide (TPR) repeat protein
MFEFETVTIPYGLPAIIDSVIVKRESFYRASVRPLGQIEAVTDCEYDTADSTSYLSDPAPHFQIFFVPMSLGDYHWNPMRNYLELEGSLLDDFVHFDDYQPVNVYLMPCFTPSVHMDKRLRMAIDPVKNNVMGIYNHDEKTIKSYAVNMLKFYRAWGYAPLIVVEGVASFADFNDYYIQEALEKGPIPDLQDYLVTADYVRCENQETTRQAAGSFFNYLVTTHGAKLFKDFYTISTDLTAAGDFEEVYGRSLESLIADWRHYLDTLQIDPGWFRFHSQRVSYLRDYGKAADLLEERLRRTGGDSDLVFELGNYYYRLGRYKDALRYFERRLDTDSVSARDVTSYANMLLINGMMDSAEVLYEKSIALDSSQAVAMVKIGDIRFFDGEVEEAVGWYQRAAEVADDDQVVIDAHLAIGKCLRTTGDLDSSRTYFASALNGAKLHMMGDQPNPLASLRAGEAFVNLGQPDPAIEQLEFAGFIEERPYYLGRIAVALGQAYDLRGDRETALEHYRSVRDIPGGYLQVQEADRYIDQPFTLD